jgi:hypothetical protein
MAMRDTYYLADVYEFCTLTGPSSIYPATQSVTKVAPSLPRHQELDSLLPWGCERLDQSQPDQS